MFLGIFFVVAACACWGALFVVPKFVENFSPLEVALGRFFVYGLLSLIYLLATKRHLLSGSYNKIWAKAFWLGLMSTFIGYTGLVICVRYASAALGALIFGMSPITIPLYGNLVKREGSFRQFLVPGLLMVLGVILVNLDALSLSSNSPLWYFVGVVGGFIGLFAWTWYTVANFHFREKNPGLSTNDWVTMQGVTTFVLVIVIGGVVGLTASDLEKYGLSSPQFHVFLAGSVVLGIVSSWVGFFLWNLGNLRLPMTFAGQLTVFEMIFGLVFVYVVEQRVPLPWELAGILVMLGGVLWAFKTLKKLSVSHG
jgi:drug/metabolite transporter (DMT)-like permease